MEHHDVDPQGNNMPTGMFWRDGIYYVRTTVSGKRLKKSTNKSDFKSALRRYHEVMKAWNDQESGWDNNSTTPTLKEYWEKEYRPSWVVGRKTPNAGTKDDYRDDTLIAHALIDLGHRKLSDITPTMAQKWVQKRRTSTYQRGKGGEQFTLSESTVAREKSLLHTVFQRAVKDEHIAKNPWEDIETDGSAVNDRVLTLDEQGKLEAAMPAEFRRFLNFMLGTGLRINEARGINETTDLLLEQKQIRVTRKSRGLKKKVQLIPLFDPNVIEVIKEQLAEQGRLWHQPRATLWWNLAVGCERAGIEHVSPHTLRHTFATRYLKAGGKIYNLSKLLGHSSVTVTEKVYAHLSTEDLGELSAGVSLGIGLPGKVLPFKQGLTA